MFSRLLMVSMIFNWKFNLSCLFCFTIIWGYTLISWTYCWLPLPNEVLDSDLAVQCDAWVHVNCDSSLTINLYNDMLVNPSDEPWFCSVWQSTNLQLHLTEDYFVYVLTLLVSFQATGCYGFCVYSPVRCCGNSWNFSWRNYPWCSGCSRWLCCLLTGQKSAWRWSFGVNKVLNYFNPS